jgi:FG-GAP-like repeat
MHRLRFAALVATIVAASVQAETASAQTQVFGPPTQYEVGRSPFSVTATDLDGDTDRDLAVANHLDDTVSILLGGGDGTFRSRAQITVGGRPLALAARDFNGDGRRDLATANSGGGSISILLGRGDGTFAVSHHIDLSSVSRPFSIAAADFNRDGHLDIATPLHGFVRVAVLLGNGNGTFTRAADLPVPFDNGNLVGIAVADFNLDAHPDLAVSDHYFSDVIVFLGRGDGTFAGGRREGVGIRPTNVEIGDFDHDGRPDIATANDISFTEQVSLLLGNGDGSFQPVRFVGLWHTNAQAIAVTAGDFDGDCRSDLATADGATGEMPSIAVLLGDGAAGFESVQPFEAGMAPYLLAAADFNGDGASDLAIPNRDDYPGTVSVALSTITGHCGTPDPGPPADTVAVTRAEYFVARRELRIGATSMNPAATLSVSVTATGERIGTLTNSGGGSYRGRFKWSPNPQQITVTSSAGGSAVATVSTR